MKNKKILKDRNQIKVLQSHIQIEKKIDVSNFLQQQNE